ncbi:MAG: MATE family efflux transporter [Thermonema sp.]|uniref:MATE family efflux transporter n=1 Tax=Thermonema sp. TaxID=2231181 RepID=UPI0021DDF9B2|nr:MATE family efflux transporter [Thermonema sp.]GIV38754.1 MAG: MATE family efflux transporter [Thermonema sp.]
MNRTMWQELFAELRKMISLSMPIIIAQIGSVFMGIIDNMMVGDLGEVPLAAAGVANPIFFLLASIGIGIFSAISPLVAKQYSETAGKKECGYILFAGMKLSISVGLVITAALLLIAANFDIFRQSKEVEIEARPYLQVIATSAVPMMFFLAVKHFSDGLSIVWPAMIITIVGLVVNVFGNWVLIYGHLGFSPMGLYGSGLSTLIARVLMACLMIVYVLESKYFRDYIPNILKPIPTRVWSRRILRLGLPSGMQYFFELGAFTGAAILAGWIGVTALAAHNVIFSIATFTYMVAAGVSFAGAIRVGIQAGKQSYHKVRIAGFASILLVSVLMLFSATLLVVFAEPVIRLYTHDYEVVLFASSVIFVFMFYQLFDGIQAVGVGILRGVFDVNVPTLITIFAYWVVCLPIAYLLANKVDWMTVASWWGESVPPAEVNKYRLMGLWIGLTTGLGVSATLLTARFYLLTREGHLPVIEKKAA